MNRIFDDDPDAEEQLTARLQDKLKEKAYWKGLKKVPRTYQHDEPDGAKRSYMLPLLNGNINGLKKRIAKIQERKAAGITLVRKPTYPNGSKRFYYAEEKN